MDAFGRDKTFRMILASVLAALEMVGIFGNMLIICMFQMDPNLHQLFIRPLVQLLSVFTLIQVILVDNIMLTCLILGQHPGEYFPSICVLQMELGNIAYSGTLWSIATIAVVRFCQCLGHLPHNSAGLTHSLAMVGAVVGNAVVTGFVSWKTYIPNMIDPRPDLTCNLSPETPPHIKSYMFIMYIYISVLPGFITVSAYYFVYSMAGAHSPMARAVFVVFLVQLVQVLPFGVLHAFDVQMPYRLSAPLSLLCSSNAAATLCVYGLVNEPFRRKMWELVGESKNEQETTAPQERETGTTSYRRRNRRHCSEAPEMSMVIEENEN